MPEKILELKIILNFYLPLNYLQAKNIFVPGQKIWILFLKTAENENSKKQTKPDFLSS